MVEEVRTEIWVGKCADAEQVATAFRGTPRHPHPEWR